MALRHCIAARQLRASVPREAANGARSRICEFLRRARAASRCNSSTFRAIGGVRAHGTRAVSIPENELGAPGPQGNVIPVTYVPFLGMRIFFPCGELRRNRDRAEHYNRSVAEDSSLYHDCRPGIITGCSELIRVGTRPEPRLKS